MYTGAEYIAQLLVEMESDVSEYQCLLYLYAELGEVDKIKNFNDRYKDIHENTVVQARIIALLVR